ncbi:hypothetical protein [Maribacter sp. 2307ULW6-5]|uniref:hypothetical protein n=1 Tax=Maribacter sp. 2307ULW6-5 TaxID=3386275 RepID=UPI0039BC86D0
MNSDYIEFKKERELGEILTDTFAFIRTQFKPFFNTYFKIVGPYLLVMVMALLAYLYFAGDTMSYFMIDVDSEIANLATVGGVGLVYVLSLVVVYTMSQSTALHYIKSYANGKGTIDFDTIKKDVYVSFWTFLGLGIMVGLTLLVGLMLCILPGIYLYVPLALSFSVLVFDRMDAGSAYNYSFGLVKGEWWMTFATIFVITLIVAIANYAFSLPAQIYQLVSMGIFSGASDAESVFNLFQDPVYLFLNAVSAIVQFLMNLISVIALVFIYFNLNEKKNFTGTYERIENLGNGKDG